MKATKIKIKDAKEYIKKSKKSKQFKAIYEALEEEGFVLKEKKRSAIGLYDESTGEKVTRVDIEYEAELDGDGYSVDFQSAYMEDGSHETIAYVRVGNLLYEEYDTDDYILRNHGYDVIKWNGDAILEENEFDEGLLD